MVDADIHRGNVAPLRELSAKFKSQCIKSQCRSTKTKCSVAGISADQLSADDASSGEPEDWKVNVTIGRRAVVFKLDTGAEVNAISEDTAQAL